MYAWMGRLLTTLNNHGDHGRQNDHALVFVRTTSTLASVREADTDTNLAFRMSMLLLLIKAGCGPGKNCAEHGRYQSIAEVIDQA